MERTQTLMRQKFGTLGAALAALALTLVLLPTVTVPASAAGTTEDIQSAITTYNSNHGGTGSLTAASDGSTVTVTGSVTDATAGLTLGIDSGVTVVWKASLSGSANYLITLSNSGAFEVAEGGSVSATGEYGKAIYADCTSATVKVEVGSVSATGENGTAIYADGTSATVEVSGGSVEATGENGNAIYSDSKNATVKVSGTGSVSATTGYAIYTNGVGATVTVSGTGSVEATGTGGRAVIYGVDVTVEGGSVKATEAGVLPSKRTAMSRSAAPAASARPSSQTRRSQSRIAAA